MIKILRRTLKSGPIENSIREKLNREFSPKIFILKNESGFHGFRHGAESHFNITIVRYGF
mgnify:CR=1 FL=1